MNIQRITSGQQIKIHPFELAGMGTGPYTFVGIHDIAEAREHAMNHMGGTHMADHPNLEAGLGTCCNCGHAINIVCIVKSSDGRLWGVGSDCVLKADDQSLGDATKVAVARRKKSIAAAKKEAKRRAEREKWLALPCRDSSALPGETNEQYIARQRAEAAAQEAARIAALEARTKVWGDIIKDLHDAKNGFLSEMAFILQERPLTERQAFCVAKHFYRAGTESHEKLQTALQQP